MIRAPQSAQPAPALDEPEPESAIDEFLRRF
jgi:hypothetical protein